MVGIVRTERTTSWSQARRSAIELYPVVWMAGTDPATPAPRTRCSAS
jgi:hypothetical protein